MKQGETVSNGSYGARWVC